MADIFLSYAREDGEIAKRLSECLESLGWSVWWDREIPAGQTWREAIEQSLANMGCMVVLWSSHSIQSDWVKEEAEEGHAQHKLVPALIDDIKPPMGFRALQAADLIGWDGARDFLGLTNLIDALESHLGKPAHNFTALPDTVIDGGREIRRRKNSHGRVGFSQLFRCANKLPWWSYATATVLVTMVIAASSCHDQRGPRHSAAVSLPVKTLDASEMQPSAPLTIRGPSPMPIPNMSPQRSPAAALGNARRGAVENKPANKFESPRTKQMPVPTNGLASDRCNEILARAQLGEPLSDAHRDALRKECQS